ncbi:hypothetical protein IKF12_00705 [Candidatus Saccharibacteria bacterium]|nr:hypothetical protein [Candidatus Saccharibacteria bacterium]
MEEDNNKPVASDEPIVLGGEKKTSKGMIAGLIVLAIVAVAGIAFGIIELMQVSNKDKEIADLNQQVTNCANVGNNSGTAEKIEVTCPDGTQMEVENTTETVDTKEYIYVGEWGLKIKKVKGLTIEKYSFVIVDDDTLSRVELYAGGEGDYPLGSVVRIGKDEEAVGLFNKVFSEGDFDYYISGPNGSIPSELEQALELVKEMITNLENYSKI